MRLQHDRPHRNSSQFRSTSLLSFLPKAPESQCDLCGSNWTTALLSARRGNMHINHEQAREALRLHGVYLLEACDGCKRLLGPVHFTRRGDSRAWCSRACRDGVEHSPTVCRGCGTSLVGKRRGATYCDRTCRMRTVRKQVRNSANIVNTHIQKKGVVDAISGFGYGGTRTGQRQGVR